MNIIKDFLTVNQYSRSGYTRLDTLAVVLHWVENAKTSAKMNRDYFESLKTGLIVNGTYRYASTQYLVGLQGEIIQTMPENEISYNCGGGKYTPFAKTFFGEKYTNLPYSPSYATIGIEFCHVDWDGTYSEATLKSAIELTASIFKNNKSLTDPMTQIIRHFDVTGKNCPKWFIDHPDDFLNFKQQVKNLL
jgi:N-acetylmuramoyl-L-alanine amidase